MFYFEGTSEVMCCYFAHRDGRECSGGQGLQWYTNTRSEIQLWYQRLTLRETGLRQPNFHFKHKPAVYLD